MSDHTPIPVTVVMRSYNDADLLRQTLAALDSQEGVEVALLVYESASKDASPEIFEEHGFDFIEHLEPGSYRSSKVLNDGARRSETECVAFVNSDAIMMSPHVLRLMAEALLSDEKVAGVFARQVVRPDADVMTRVDYHVAFENREQLGPEAEKWMSLVCSMVRRSVWEKFPFDEQLTFAEDAVWSHRILQEGYDTRYVFDAVVEHSHNYGWEQRYRRTYGDTSALAAILPDKPGNWLSGFFVPYLKRCVRDAIRLVEIGKPLSVWRSPFYRWPLLMGQWKGQRDGWKFFHGEKSEGLQPVVKPPKT